LHSFNDRHSSRFVFYFDPKTDLENDNPEIDTFNEESEVVALGQVQAGIDYSMATYWNDYRDGSSGDSSTIQAQFNMSNKPWYSADYNNCYTVTARFPCREMSGFLLFLMSAGSWSGCRRSSRGETTIIMGESECYRK
jgi:hypothetical protein